MYEIKRMAKKLFCVLRNECIWAIWKHMNITLREMKRMAKEIILGAYETNESIWIWHCEKKRLQAYMKVWCAMCLQEYMKVWCAMWNESYETMKTYEYGLWNKHLWDHMKVHIYDMKAYEKK